MLETTIVPIAILLAALALVVSAALSMGQVRSPAASAVRRVRMTVLCPETARPTQVELAPADGPAVLSICACERFPDGAITCNRECIAPVERAA